MIERTLNDITDYIDFLRRLGYMVTVSCFHKNLGVCLPTLLKYEVHMHQICLYLKINEKTRGKCSKNKGQLINKKPDMAYYSCCYSGVEEFVIPIKYDNIMLMCIHVSGYRGKYIKSLNMMKRIAKLCDERFNAFYNELSENVPDISEIIKITKPLEYMIKELFILCTKTEKDITIKEKIYQKAIEFIYENYMNNISCEDVARSVNYSTSYVRHVFLESSGITLAAYIANVRLTKAKQLMENTTRSITEIAGLTGFCDANYFSVAFKRKYKLSPKRFRVERDKISDTIATNKC